ncbi:hypothetical protein, partial [Oenococcus oeni]
MESKYYHTKTQQEWDWLFKHFNLVNENPEEYKWSINGMNTLVETPSYGTNNWAYYSVHLGITDFIEVSDLMKEEKQDKIIFTKEEKKEFDELKKDWATISGALGDIYHGHDFYNLHHSIYSKQNTTKSINLKELEFARAWAHPDLIEVKEARFAYKLKPEFIKMFNVTRSYLGINGNCQTNPQYYTAKEWKKVNDDLKVIFDRVEKRMTIYIVMAQKNSQ